MSSNAAIDRCNREIDAADNGINVRNTLVDTYRNDGVEGDTSHAGEGYHTHRNNLSSKFDYSGGNAAGINTNPRDLGGPGDQACATDLGFDATDMISATKNLIAAAERGDPRMKNLREFNGWLGGPEAINRDQELGWRQNYTPNASHKSHIHLGFYRDTAGDYDAIKGVYEIIEGIGLGEEDDMSAEDKAKIVAQGNDINKLKAAQANFTKIVAGLQAATAEASRLAQVLAGLRPPAPGDRVALPPLVPFIFGLKTGDKLATGQRLWSEDGRYNLTPQDDGNLVLRGVDGAALWWTGAKGKGLAAYLVVQGDGNVVLYTGGGKALWSSRTTTTKAVKLQSDGNLVFRDAANGAVFATGRR